MPKTKSPTIIKENLKLKNTWQVNLSPLKTCKGRKCLSICFDQGDLCYCCLQKESTDNGGPEEKNVA